MAMQKIKQFNDEQILDLLDNCRTELENYYDESQSYGALLAAQDARDAYEYLMCELTVRNHPEQIH